MSLIRTLLLLLLVSCGPAEETPAPAGDMTAPVEQTQADRDLAELQSALIFARREIAELKLELSRCGGRR